MCVHMYIYTQRGKHTHTLIIILINTQMVSGWFPGGTDFEGILWISPMWHEKAPSGWNMGSKVRTTLLKWTWGRELFLNVRVTQKKEWQRPPSKQKKELFSFGFWAWSLSPKSLGCQPKMSLLVVIYGIIKRSFQDPSITVETTEKPKTHSRGSFRSTRAQRLALNVWRGLLIVTQLSH